MGLDINLNTSKIDISEDDGLNVDLYGDNVSVSEDDSDDIIIEITGLKSINKFIGLEDTPLYYDNGKFFKVENNKIIYADIEWSDISGDLNDAPEIIALIQKLIEKTTDTIVNNYIHLHNINQEAHPYIQNIIQDNYNILNRKIDNSQEELFQDITSLTGALDNEIEERQAADSLLSENLQEETLARIDAQTSLHNNISNLNTLLEDEVTARTEGDSLLENSLGALTDELLQEISNRQTQDNALQGQITSNFNILNEKINTESNDRVESDTLLQNNIDTLTNNVNSLSTTVSNNYTTLDNKINSTKTELEGDIDTLSTTVTNNYNDLSGSIASNTQAISTETTNRQNADNNLQSQIDAITASSDVTDIVGTYAQLQAYDTSTLPPNSIIKVLQDEHQNNETTYYRWVITGGVGAWVLIGEEGPYYTKSEADGRFVPQTRTINGKDLSNNISLDASDVGALPSSTVIPTVNNGTLDIQVNGTSVGTFTANQSGNTTANIVVPDSATWGNITGDLTDQTDLQDALDNKQDKLTAGTDLEIINGSSVHNLPEGYTEVEYIQASGNAGILTSVAGNINTSVTLIANCTQILPTSQVIISDGYDGNGGTYFGQPALKSTWGAGANGSQLTSLSVLMKTEFNISSTITSTFALNGTVTQGSTIQTFSRAGTVPVSSNYTNWSLFGSINKATNTIAYPTYGKVFYAKFEQNNTVVAEYIPAIRNSDNAVGLYDIINDTFIGKNLGTGTLIAGEEVAETTTINFTNESGYALQSDVNSALALKQDVLTAGTGIDITNNVISNTQTSAEWGNITGDIEDQTDLQNVLNDKQDVLTAGTDLEIIAGSGAILPDTYEELEYIQSDGACYIDTGIISNGTDTIEQKFQKLGTSTTTCSWFGSMQGNNLLRFSIGSYYKSSVSKSVFMGGYNFTQQIGDMDTNAHVVKFYCVGNTYYDEFDGLLVTYQPTNEGSNPTINSWLFARHGADGVDTIYDNEGTKIFYHKQKRFNGTAILDLVPARRIADGELGFYNLVNNTFLTNSGSGTLTGGNVVSHSNNTVINFTNESGYALQTDVNADLALKQDSLTAGTDLEIVQGSILPNSYTQLTSITSTGTQWINSGIKLTNSFKSIIVGKLTGTPSANFRTILGANNSNLSTGKQNVLLGWGNSSNGFYAEPCLAPSYTYSSYPWDTNTHTFTTNVTSTATTLNIDGVIDTINSAPSITGVNLAIFARLAQNGTVGSQVNFELNSIELYQSGSLVFNGVPAKRNSDDEVGLYDTVSSSFFPNSGTGDFIAGSVVPASTVINFTNESGYILPTQLQSALENYYTKSQTYTKTEINQLIADIPKFTVSVVQSLPATGEAMTLYLVPKAGTNPDIYNEYVWVESASSYELIGSTAVDLSDYYNKTETDTLLNDKQDKLTAGRYIEIVEGGTLSTLPSGCSQVEYITATGTQHLDTLITASQDYEIRAKFRLSELNDSFLYGARQAYGDSSFALHKNYAPFSTDVGTGYVNLGVESWYIVKQNKNGIYINDVIAHSYSNSLASFTTPNTIRVFAMAQGNNALYSNTYMKGDFAEFEIYNNGNLVCKLVPCTDMNDVVCMYDTVNERFLYNQGTGTFTAGAVVAGSDTINCTIEDTDISTILGYTPVKSVNNILPIDGNVTLTLPASAEWGNITGTLSNQTDLQNALNAKSKITIKDWTVN